VIDKLINLANYLDKSGLKREADRVDRLIVNATSCNDVIENRDKAFRDYKSKLQDAQGRGCIKGAFDDTGGYEVVTNEGLCGDAIKDLKAASVAWKAADDTYASKCGPNSAGPGGSRCRGQVGAWNRAVEELNGLMDAHEEQCLGKDNDYWTNDNITKCRELQTSIDEKNKAACAILIGAREACGCSPRDGGRKCNGRIEGHKYYLPGVWNECRE
jgi:hypothetical protein